MMLKRVLFILSIISTNISVAMTADIPDILSAIYYGVNFANLSSEEQEFYALQVNVRDQWTSPLLSAVSWGRSMPILTWLVTHGADVNACSRGGRTVLNAAIWQGDAAAVELLLNHHVDYMLANRNGNTPLQLAKIALLSDHPGLKKRRQSVVDILEAAERWEAKKIWLAGVGSHC